MLSFVARQSFICLAILQRCHCAVPGDALNHNDEMINFCRWFFRCCFNWLLCVQRKRQKGMNSIRDTNCLRLMEGNFVFTKDRSASQMRVFFFLRLTERTIAIRFVCVLRKYKTPCRIECASSTQRTRINYLLLSRFETAECHNIAGARKTGYWLRSTVERRARVRSRHAWAMEW